MAPRQPHQLSPRHRRLFVAVGYAFIVGYFATVLVEGAIWTEVLLLASLVPLLLYSIPRTTRFVRAYATLAAAAAVATLLWHALDVNLLMESLADLVKVIGLLAVLRVIALPLRTNRHRKAFEGAMSKARRKGVHPNTVAVGLGFVLGQLLAFTVLPLVHEIVAGGDDAEHTQLRASTLWSGRGLTATILWAVAFPTVSVAIDVFTVPVLTYFVVALPLALLLVTLLIIWTQVTFKHEQDGGEREVALPAQPLMEIGAYLAVIIGGILSLATIYRHVSYLGLVAIVVLLASVGFQLLLNRKAPIKKRLNNHFRYAQSWWSTAGEEIYIFTGGGLILYALRRTEILTPVARGLVDFGNLDIGALLVYPLLALVVAILFIAGIHPIVSVHVMALALAPFADETWVSLPVVTLALMVGTVAALTPSPFSALTNLRASMSGTHASTAFRENVVYGVVVLSVGSAYLIALRTLGI